MRPIAISAQSIWQDLKYGIRQLWSNPGFTMVAVLTLALGIGVNTSIFSLLNALMLRPLAVPNSASVFGIYRGDERPSSYPDVLDLQQRTTAFAGLVADATNESALDVGDTSEVILAEAVSYNFAAVLQVKPLLGRWFSPEDEHGAFAFPAVISHRIWQSRLGGDPGVIGKQVRLESRTYTIIGVAPRDFQGLALPVMTGVWVPLVSYAKHNTFAARLVKNRQGKVLVFGRLKPGVTARQAEAELNTVDEQLRRDYPRPEGERRAMRLEPARGTADPGYRRPVGQLMMMLTALAFVVLLIGCANVANLLLSRGVSRRREVSIRMSLGASRSRICRQLLVESALLSLMGSAAGLAAALWTNTLFESALSSAKLPIAVGASLSLDGRVFGFVLAVSVVTMLLFGLLPALRASRPDLVPALKGGETFSRRRRFAIRNVSVVAQVALSLVLMIVAGLFVRALQSVQRIDPGFDAHGLLSARLFVAEREFNPTMGMALYGRAIDRVRTLPGVRSATLSYASPMLTMSKCALPEKTSSLAEPINASANTVGPDYFSTFGIPLVRGRAFTSGDNSSTPPVVIVNESFARRYWLGRDPVGNRIRVGPGCEKGQGSVAEIVGVAKDAQYASAGQTGRPFVFFPLAQQFVGYLALVVRTEHDPAQLTPTLRKELRNLDSRLRIYEIDSLTAQMDESLWQIRWEGALVGSFGLLALLIAFVGLYGVIAFVAKRRMREFGIRMALGAQRHEVLRLVASDALRLTLAGIALGLFISLAATGLLRSFLYGLSPTDGLTYVSTVLLWTVVGLVASCVPAYRATRVDPSQTLREE